MIEIFAVGFRALRRTPLFTLCIIAALAIGIGSTTALFSVVHALLFKPLPYKNADALVVMWEHNLTRNQPRNVASPANFLAWQARSRSFENMAAFTQGRVTLTGAGEPQELATMVVTGGIFNVLGVAPALGRGFITSDDQPDAAGTIVLSHAAWVRQFGGDASAIGRDITINGNPVTIIGVMPANFDIFGLPADGYMPLRLPAQVPFRGRSIIPIGRLKPGVTIQQAQAEMEGVFAQVRSEQPDFNTGWSINLVPLREQLVGDVRLTVLVLFGAVAAVLLIACGNIGSLMLTRASARRRELAIRSALGAGSGRLLAQLTCESLMLSIAGGAFGILLATWLLRGLAAIAASRLPLPLMSQVTLDPSVLAFAAVITVLTTIVCGLAPAVGATSGSLVTALRDGAPSVAGSKRSRIMRQSLVTIEIALAMTVLCGAGLLARSVLELQNVRPGFNVESALSFRVSLPRRSYGDANAEHAFYTRVIDGLRALPEVTAVGGTSFLPLAGVGPATSFWRADAPQPPPDQRPVVDARPVTSGYFAAMQIPLLAGRDVNDDRDTDDRDPVAVINEAFAKQIYPGENPIGRRFILNLGDSKPHEIIGIVGDVKLVTLEGEARPTAYLSSRQYAFGLMTFVVRTAGDPSRLAPAAVHVVRTIDPLLPVSAVRPLDDVFAESIARPRMTALVMSVFAGAALLLAALGVYGIVAYSVSQRSREFGIRLALGARSGQVVSMVVAQNLRVVAIGVALGILSAIPATRLLRGLLYQVGPNDPATFIAIGVTLGLVAIVAAYLPARRGTRVDPVVTLKSE